MLAKILKPNKTAHRTIPANHRAAKDSWRSSVESLIDAITHVP